MKRTETPRRTSRPDRKWWVWLVLGPIGLATLLAGSALFVGACLFAAPGYRGPRSSHFDGERFHNQMNVKPKTFRDVLKWWRHRNPGPWRAYRETPRGAPPPRAVAPGQLRVTFINHATTLIQLDGVNILTDPIWSKRASPVSFAGPSRARPAGIRFGDLPPIHVVVISHNHYDHLDLPTLKRLHRAHRPLVLAGLGNRRLLEGAGIRRARDLEWWQSRAVGDVTIDFVPAQHWSSRGFGDRNKTLWGGFVVEGTRHTVYFAGDTGFGPHFQQIRQRYGPMDLALLPIGAYKPRWFMRSMHMNPAEAVRAHRVLEARRSVPIHYGTFQLGDDGEDEPLRDLRIARVTADVSADVFRPLGFGEGVTVEARPLPFARQPHVARR